MYNEESVLTGGLGIWLAFGLFAITTVIGIGVFFWFLEGQKEEKKKLAEKPAAELADELLEKQVAIEAPKPGGFTDAVAPPKSFETASVSNALTKTRASLFGRIQNLFGGKQTLSEAEREELEEILYTADLGPKTVQDLLDHVFDTLKASGETGFEAVRRELAKKIGDILENTAQSAGALASQVADGDSGEADGVERLKIFDAKPAVLMVVGVNGAGKTTTIGKLAAKLAGRGRRVLVAAGDTFRAAAGEQLKTWTERAAVVGGADVVGSDRGDAGQGKVMVEIFDPPGVTEPSAVAYQALEKGRAQGFDIVIVDTAGRLHTQKNLMEELKKMKRVLSKLDPSAPHETLLVLDANSGQNALIQAKEFHGALTVDGVVLTKLDGSAKGGVAVGISHEVGLPIKLIGVGEKIGDLRPFAAREFVESILG